MEKVKLFFAFIVFVVALNFHASTNTTPPQEQEPEATTQVAWVLDVSENPEQAS